MRSPIERAAANITVLRRLGELRSSGEEPSYDDLQMLALYSGWGGAPLAFDESGRAGARWTEFREALRGLLSEEEYAEARASTLTAFYTPGVVVAAVYSTLGDLGLPENGGSDGIHVLEPGCGTGNFLAGIETGGLPWKCDGIEVDRISAEIAGYLNPSSRVVNASLDRVRVEPGSYDAVIGNVPFSDSIKFDAPSGESRASVPIHDYFIERSVDALRPGGYAVLITSRYTLDKDGEAARRWIAQRAELLGAVRLPGTTFAEQAGTEVVSDIIVLRKREALVEEPHDRWVSTGGLPAPDGSSVSINQYFLDNPENVIGGINLSLGRYGYGIEVPFDGTVEDIGRACYAVLSDIAADALHEGKGYGSVGKRLGAPMCAEVPDAAAAALSYVLDDAGGVWYGDGETVEPVDVPAGDRARLAAMVRLRDEQLRLLELERSTADDAEVDRAIASLNDAYSAFTASYGNVTSAKNRRVWATCNDYSGAFLRSLEVTDSLGRVIGLGDVLSKRVQSPVGGIPDHVDSARDALTVSLDQRQGVDMELICRISGKDEDTVLEELDDALLKDPFTGEVVLADAFLSGDVGGKLRRLDGSIRNLEHGRDRLIEDAWAEQCGIAAAERSAFEERQAAIDSVKDRINSSSGAWEAFCHPDSALSFMDTDSAAAAGLHERWVGRDTRAAILLGILQDAEPGAVLRRADGGATYLWGLAAQGGLGAHCDPESLAILRAVAKRDDIVSDEEFGFLISRSDYLSSSAVARCLQSILGDDFELPRPRSRDEIERFLPLAQALRGNPDILDYLVVASFHMQEEERRRNGLSWMEARDLPPITLGDRDGFAAFIAEKDAFVSAIQDDYPATDADLVAGQKALRERLAAALPPRLDAGEIAVNLGAPWIPLRYYYDFAAETFGFDAACQAAYAGDTPRSKWVVARSPETGAWQFRRSGAPELMPEALDRFGVPEMHPLSLMESAMNGSVISITKPDPSGELDENGNPKRVKDPAATAAAYHKRDMICQAFREWCFADADRARELADIYNDRFNCIAPRSYDGGYITLPGSNPAIKLRSHQKDAVARVLQSDEGTLIAHSVGAGKTFAGIAAVMESRRTGRSGKPLVVVPNHLTEQWATDFLRLYPSAKILTMGKADMKSQDATRDFWARAAAGDWDAVIVGQSRFDMLGLSPARKMASTQRRISELEQSIASAKKDGMGFTVKQLEAAKKRAERTLGKLRDSKQTEGMDFETCGFDFLLVDEAHGYKNLAIVGRSVAGMSSTSSKKCENLVDVCDYLREIGRGGSIVFATGTPVSNTMSELYNMERYLAPGILKSQGVYVFSDWAQCFGETVQSVEVKPESNGFQVKERFAKFHNLPELMAGFHMFADIMTADDLDLDVPQVESVTVAVDASDEQRELVKELGRRADIIRSGGVDPSVDNLLKITSEGRALALSPRLLAESGFGADGYGSEDGKLQACAKNVYEVWCDTKDVKGTQLVFCDTSTPGKGKWNVYDEIKAQIIGMGIPEREIAFVHDCGNDPAKRDALFERVNDGEVRVLFGSTQKLGTGTNVQARLAAIHDVDCPWRPSDLEQRLGRIQRQGNMFDEVKDYRYVTTGTFDSYLYQTVERKQRFISQVFTSKNPARSGDDLDEAVLDFATIKAVAAGDPKVRERLQREVRLQELELQRQSWLKSRQTASFNIKTRFAPAVGALEESVSNLEDDHETLEASLETLRSRKATGLGADITVGQIRDGDQSRQVARILSAYSEHRDTITRYPCHVPLGDFCGVGFGLRFVSDEDCRVYISAAHSYVSDKRLSLQKMGPETCVRQLERLLEKTADGLDDARVRLSGARERLRQAREAADAPWEFAEEYEGLTMRLAEDEAELVGMLHPQHEEASPDSFADRMSMAKRIAEASAVGSDPLVSGPVL